MSEFREDPEGEAVGDALELAITHIVPDGIRTASIERALFMGVLYIVRFMSRVNQ